MKNIEVYGLSGFEYERRKSYDLIQLNDIKEGLDIIVEHLKQVTKDGEWVKLSYADVTNIYEFPKKNNRETFLYQLKDHPNIITTIKMDIKEGETELPKTSPYLYRYVSEKTKKDMKFDSVVYRRIILDRLELLKGAFNGEKLNYNALLCVADYLVREKFNEGWRVIDTVKISSLCGISIDEVLEMLDLLEKHELLVLSPYVDEEKNRSVVCAFCIDRLDYQTVLKEKETKAIKLFDYVKPKRNRRRGELKDSLIDAVAQKHNSTTEKDDEEFQSKIDDLIQNNGEVLKVNVNPEFLEEKSVELKNSNNNSIDKVSEYAKMVSDSISAVLNQYLADVGEILNQKEQKDAEAYAVLERLTKENRGQSEEIRELKEENRRLKERVNTLNGFNEQFIDNSQVALNILMGKLISQIEAFMSLKAYERNSPAVVSTAKVELLKVASEAVNSILNFRPESKLPPTLKK